jgi:hydroxymethylpyrimidine/phosphomethylpyrimidine kinase
MAEAGPPKVLTIAGSDSGGGAGIQADLKAFAAAGAHGMSAITAITAQNTVGVEEIHPIPPSMIVAQVRAVVDDIGVDAAKVGMLGRRETVIAVVEALDLLAGAPIVVDPVMVAESGAPLLEPDARRAVVEELLPLASVATPNLAEARELAGLEAGASIEELAAAIRALGPDAVIVTGGHGEDGVDLLDDGSGEPVHLPGEIHPPGASHGSGCTHAATLAALLARGVELRAAAARAREVTARAVAQGLRDVGRGAGPVDVLGVTGRGGSSGG